MGIVRMGLPEEIVLYLKELSKIELFIETGTFSGWTSYWASSHFNLVKTIEFSVKFYHEAKKTHANLSNVDFIFGDSRKELTNIISKINEPAIFWLDAHWCGSESYGVNDQCPILEEIEIIISSRFENIILIDDARLFLSPPPLPNSTEYYPSVSEILSKFVTKKYHTIIYEDALISIPKIYKKDFVNFMQNRANEDEIIYNKLMKKKEDLKKIKRFIKKSIFYKYWRNV
jgi:hypothetical protein